MSAPFPIQWEVHHWKSGLRIFVLGTQTWTTQKLVNTLKNRRLIVFLYISQQVNVRPENKTQASTQHLCTMQFLQNLRWELWLAGDKRCRNLLNGINERNSFSLIAGLLHWQGFSLLINWLLQQIRDTRVPITSNLLQLCHQRKKKTSYTQEVPDEVSVDDYYSPSKLDKKRSNLGTWLRRMTKRCHTP